MLEKDVEELKDSRKGSTGKKTLLKRERTQKGIVEEKSKNRKQINSIQQHRFSMRILRTNATKQRIDKHTKISEIRWEYIRNIQKE